MPPVTRPYNGPRKSPAINRRLAVRLREIRLEEGLSSAQVAQRCRFTQSKLSRIETGHTGISLADLRTVLGVLHVEEPERTALLDLAADREGAPVTGPGYSRELAIPEYVEAGEADEWAPQVIPAPLRTEAYAQAVLASTRLLTREPKSVLARRVRDGLTWQSRVTDAVLSYRVVLDESALFRYVGSPEIMGDQIDLLASLAELPNVDFSVLTLGAVVPQGVSAFTYLRYRQRYGISQPDAVLLHDGLRDPVRTDAEGAADLFEIAFAELRGIAVQAGYREILKRAAETWGRG